MSSSEPSAIVLHGIPRMRGYTSFDSNGENGSLKLRRDSLFYCSLSEIRLRPSYLLARMVVSKPAEVAAAETSKCRAHGPRTGGAQQIDDCTLVRSLPTGLLR